jgi:hemerythrin superfamily protein
MSFKIYINYKNAVLVNFKQTKMISDYKTIEELIIQDHNETRAVFKKYNDEFNRDEKFKWYRQMVYLIAKHSIAEEIVLYPLIREKLHNGDIMADLDIEQHRRVKEQIANLQDNVNWDSPEFDLRVKALWSDVIKHMDKEENEDLKVLPLQVPLQERIDAAKRFENRKMLAPSRVHLNTPDENPAMETIMGLLLAPIDKFKDLFAKFPDSEQIEQVKDQSTKMSSIGQMSSGYSAGSRTQI